MCGYGIGNTNGGVPMAEVLDNYRILTDRRFQRLLTCATLRLTTASTTANSSYWNQHRFQKSDGHPLSSGKLVMRAVSSSHITISRQPVRPAVSKACLLLWLRLRGRGKSSLRHVLPPELLCVWVIWEKNSAYQFLVIWKDMKKL